MTSTLEAALEALSDGDKRGASKSLRIAQVYCGLAADLLEAELPPGD